MAETRICFQIQTKTFVLFIAHFPHWLSLPVVDAFFKVPSGVLDGDFTWPGQYDECVEINEVFTDHQPYNMTFLIRGKYFMANIGSVRIDAMIY